MIRIVVGGQIDKENIARMIREVGKDKVSVEIKGDIQAATDIKAGKADYYVGACTTGGGGALGLAIAILGMPLCSTVAMPGKIKTEEEIIQDIKNGKKAFGFTPESALKVIPIIINECVK
jgi:hypothetical protein